MDELNFHTRIADCVRYSAGLIFLAISASGLGGQTPDIDLNDLGESGFKIDCSSFTNISVSGAGDFSGDGLADVILSAPTAIVYYREGTPFLFWFEEAGLTYVVRGKRESGAASLCSPGSGSTHIKGNSDFEHFGASVSGAGDVDGDGKSDIVVGAPDGTNPYPDEFIEDGTTHVIFGTSVSHVLDTLALTWGSKVTGSSSFAYSGRSVSGLGDVNGDGISDVVTGAPGMEGAGGAFVLFSDPLVPFASLADLAHRSIRINGSVQGDLLGSAVSGAGDVNGDGIPDVIAAAPNASPAGRTLAGETYVIYGKSDSAEIEVSDLGQNGFRILGAETFDRSGTSVAGAGDVNGDGLADVLIGAPEATRKGAAMSGVGYVVFGKKDSNEVDLGDLGAGGIRIYIDEPFRLVGYSVAGAGDLNGDGYSDVLVGVPGDTDETNDESGSVYAIYGGNPLSDVNLSALRGSSQGLWIKGQEGARAGFSVSGAGDVNGDGLSDIVTGSESRRSAVVFGFSETQAASATYRTHLRLGPSSQRAIGVIGDGSDSTSPPSRVWVKMSTVEGDQANQPLLRVTLNRNSGSFPDAAAHVHWEITSEFASWSAASLTFRYLQNELVINAQCGLRLYFAASKGGPFHPLATIRDTVRNTLSTAVDQFGYYYVGVEPTATDTIIRDGFGETC